MKIFFKVRLGNKNHGENYRESSEKIHRIK